MPDVPFRCEGTFDTAYVPTLSQSTLDMADALMGYHNKLNIVGVPARYQDAFDTSDTPTVYGLGCGGNMRQ